MQIDDSCSVLGPPLGSAGLPPYFSPSPDHLPLALQRDETLLQSLPSQPGSGESEL